MSGTSREVYIIHDESGRRKIGFSGNVHARLAQLRVASSRGLVLERHFPCGVTTGHSVERLAHKLLADKRLDGEWFDVSLEEAVEAIETAIGIIEAGLPSSGNKEAIGVRLTDEERDALAAAAEGKSLARKPDRAAAAHPRLPVHVWRRTVTETQERIDRFYAERGPCCAGCDHWAHLNVLVGECQAGPPVGSADRMLGLRIEGCSIPIGAVRVLTLRDYFCGAFKDEFDWQSLPAAYLRRIGMEPVNTQRTPAEASQRLSRPGA